MHARARILSDRVQIYNCSAHCTVTGNQCNCSQCNQDTVRLNSGAPAQLSITRPLCFTLLCSRVSTQSNSQHCNEIHCASSFVVPKCTFKRDIIVHPHARVNCNLLSTRGNLCTPIIARALLAASSCAVCVNAELIGTQKSEQQGVLCMALSATTQ